MELGRLIEALSATAAYPVPTERVEVRHTHISVVFLVGDYAYKIKKPARLGFLDFSTMERRRHFCEEEVRLNCRLAPDVYLGVVPVTHSGAALKLEGQGEVAEWAVKMRRLPDESTLESRLQRGTIEVETIEALARKIAAFHARAESGPHIAALGRFDVVAANASQNFGQATLQVGTEVSGSVLESLQSLTEKTLELHRNLIERRAERGVPRDTHGDLRLEHIYYLSDRKPPADIAIIDCVEFNEQLRFADPVADIAFLVMDLKFHGRRDLAEAFTDAYFQASNDEEGRVLVSFYSSYRAAVRGKVEGFKSVLPEIPEAARTAALEKARGYWLMALEELEQPNRKACLVLVGGLPGTGKSTLAADLAARSGFCVIRSDLVRKQLAGVAWKQHDPQAFGRGIYADDWNDRTYAECLRQAERLLFEGKRVVVDASFREEARRRAFLESAARWRVPVVLLLCQADPNAVRERLANRPNDISDANWSIYLRIAESWEEADPVTKPAQRIITTVGSREQTFNQVLAVLRDEGLAEQMTVV
jgi:uncharacterized protein